MTAGRTVAAVFSLLFLFAAAVQYNDPDPFGWIAIYLAAAASCLITVLRRADGWLAAATAAAALVWASTLAPLGLQVPPASLFAEWEMQDERIEIAREMYGLLIVAAVCAPLAFFQRRKRG